MSRVIASTFASLSVNSAKQPRSRQSVRFSLSLASCHSCFVNDGGLAQLGERGVRNAEVGGSNPLPSTTVCQLYTDPRSYSPAPSSIFSGSHGLPSHQAST